MIRRQLLVGLALLATGCTDTASSGPSLLPRAVESRSDAEPVTPPAPAATPDAALDAQVAGLVAARAKATDGFADDDRRVAGLIAGARGAAVGSDAWLDAQTALASLDAGRASISSVLTDLEQLAIARTAAGQPPYPALETARTETEAELARVTAVVAERKSALPL